MSDDLQFDKAETSQPAGPECQSCRTPLSGHYFQAGNMLVCEKCAAGIRAHLAGAGLTPGRFSHAMLLGAGASVLGAIAYGLWIGFTKSEFALVTIAIGWFVGKSVRKGSGGLGGMSFGIAAVLLTYVSISMSFLVAGIVELMQHAPAGTGLAPDVPAEGPGLASALISLFVMSLQFPITAAKESILSALITGFGLWQAWVMNRPVNLEITGPHALAGTPPQSTTGG